MTQREAVIVEAVRTAVGRRGGQLKDWHPVDLLAQTLSALVQRTKIDAGLVEDVIIGCVSQVGEQSLNVGRNAVLAAGFPETVPGTTVDRQCGSSQQAIPVPLLSRQSEQPLGFLHGSLPLRDIAPIDVHVAAPPDRHQHQRQCPAPNLNLDLRTGPGAPLHGFLERLRHASHSALPHCQQCA